jgi:hypothetical protein
MTLQTLITFLQNKTLMRRSTVLNLPLQLVFPDLSVGFQPMLDACLDNVSNLFIIESNHIKLLVVVTCPRSSQLVDLTPAMNLVLQHSE